MRAAGTREVKEETGLEVELGRVVWVGEHISDSHHIVLVDFLGSVVGGVLEAADDAEAAEWVAIDDVRDYPLTPTMYDLIADLDASAL